MRGIPKDSGRLQEGIQTVHRQLGAQLLGVIQCTWIVILYNNGWGMAVSV